MSIVNKTDRDWNYTMLVSTVDTLKSSQGFYSRLAAELAEMSEEEKEQLKEQLANQPKFNDSVDVVMFLEG
ncbi:MAG: hypothetical protein ACI4V7_12415 [Succinivibrionaceae bacterium]